jgi:transposase
VNSERGWKTVSAISAVAWRPRARRRRRFRLYFRAHNETIKSPQVIDFLRHLLRQVPGPIDVIWDGLSGHHSAETKAFIASQPRLRVHRLPSYSPHLNPDEFIWSHLKKNGMAHYTPEHISQLRVKLRHSVVRLQRRQDVLAACFCAAKVSTKMDEGQ